MNKLKLSLVMLIWGSIGVFTRYVDVSPILLAFLRALIAIPVLYGFRRIQNRKERLRFRKLVPFVASGFVLGLAWVCLFIAFKKTSISIALLAYNMCPVYVLILAPLLLKEPLKKIQILSIMGAFLGFLIIVGSALDVRDFRLTGLILGTISGLLYACLVLINRKVKTEYDSSTVTLVQMISAVVILTPFVITEGSFLSVISLDSFDVLLILILGSVHTGVAYHLYFSTYRKLSSVTIVAFSYLEPVFGILLSIVLLHEPISAGQIAGGILILGSTCLGEVYRNGA
jgi:drug/metabolite transporter (DMT)-like permease